MCAKRKAYSIDYINNTITVSRDFYEQLQNPGSEEYALVRAVQMDYPQMKVVHRTHATPNKYRTKSGEEFSCNQFKNLTYKNMASFIEGLPGSEVYMQTFNFLKEHASLPQPSRYKATREWFVAQFPEFRKNPLFYIYNTPDLIDFTAIVEEVRKQAQENAAKKTA